MATHLNIELRDELAAAVKAEAQAQGISPDRYISRVLESTLALKVELDPSGQYAEPFKTDYGLWGKYGPAPSAEEIDENRREMFRNFGKEI